MNNIIYEINIKTSSYSTRQEEHIEFAMNSESTTVEVVEEENLLSFENIGEAQEYFNSFNTANRFCQTINGE